LPGWCPTCAYAVARTSTGAGVVDLGRFRWRPLPRSVVQPDPREHPSGEAPGGCGLEQRRRVNDRRIRRQPPTAQQLALCGWRLPHRNQDGQGAFLLQQPVVDRVGGRASTLRVMTCSTSANTSGQTTVTDASRSAARAAWHPGSPMSRAATRPGGVTDDDHVALPVAPLFRLAASPTAHSRVSALTAPRP
jgi:hypothetical protein